MRGNAETRKLREVSGGTIPERPVRGKTACSLLPSTWVAVVNSATRKTLTNSAMRQPSWATGRTRCAKYDGAQFAARRSGHCRNVEQHGSNTTEDASHAADASSALVPKNRGGDDWEYFDQNCCKQRPGIFIERRAGRARSDSLREVMRTGTNRAWAGKSTKIEMGICIGVQPTRPRRPVPCRRHHHPQALWPRIAFERWALQAVCRPV